MMYHFLTARQMIDLFDCIFSPPSFCLGKNNCISNTTMCIKWLRKSIFKPQCQQACLSRSGVCAQQCGQACQVCSRFPQAFKAMDGDRRRKQQFRKMLHDELGRSVCFSAREQCIPLFVQTQTCSGRILSACLRLCLENNREKYFQLLLAVAHLHLF